MLANKNILQRVYRFFAILVILGLAWTGFLWLTQAPPVDAIPSLLMVWATAIVLLLAFFPVVNGSLQPNDIAIIHQALEEKDEFVLVAAKGGFKSALVLDDFSRVIAHKTLGSLIEEVGRI